MIDRSIPWDHEYISLKRGNAYRWDRHYPPVPDVSGICFGVEKGMSEGNGECGVIGGELVF